MGRGTFLGHEIISMGPPSSGGVVLVEMLGMFESLGLERLPRGSAEAIHLTTEIRRRAYLDHARYRGDPDVVAMPIERRLSQKHAAALAVWIDPATDELVGIPDLRGPDAAAVPAAHE